MENKEFTYKGLTLNGFLALFLELVIFACAIFLFVKADGNSWYALPAGILLLLFAICMSGFIKLEPNEAKALVFFGKYSGTFFKTGFYWVNPLILSL